MASDGEDIERNDIVSSTEMQKSRTLTLPPSLSSSFNPLGDPLAQPILLLDIMKEIFCRLPVKLLSQLRCVCKSWNSLISDPKFVKKHLHWSSMNPTRHRLIFCPSSLLHFYTVNFNPSSLSNIETTHAMRLDHPVNNPYPNSMIVGSCDGILCITVNQYDIFLWNPSIQNSKQFPTLECPPQEPGYLTFLCHIVYGFGYDNVANSYKLVALFRHTNVCEAKVHTLGTDSWRLIKDFPSMPEYEAGKLVSGMLNWFSKASRNIIISFDLVKECFQELRLPDFEGEYVDVTLAVLRDCLCIFHNSHTFSDVWIMNEYGNKDSWTKLFRVPNSFNPRTKVLYVYEDDEVVLESKSRLTVYNYKSGTSRSPDIEYISKFLRRMEPHRYMNYMQFASQGSKNPVDD